MLAAIMSTLDSGINSLATVITKDFYVRFWRPGAEEPQQVRFSRTMTVATGAAVIGMSLSIAALAASVRGTVLESSGVWMSLLVVLAPVFLLGVTSRRARQWHALSAMGLGVVLTALMTVWYYRAKGSGHEPGFFMVAVVPFLATLAAGYGLSRFARRRSRQELADLTLFTLGKEDSKQA
jgi:Na+/proline symporter